MPGELPGGMAGGRLSTRSSPKVATSPWQALSVRDSSLFTMKTGVRKGIRLHKQANSGTLTGRSTCIALRLCKC